MTLLISALFLLSLLLWIPLIVDVIRHKPLNDLSTGSYACTILGCSSCIVAIVLWIMMVNL